MQNILSDLIADHRSIFKNKNDLRAFFAPGRINLIGEHTDYNGGHVFPCALSFGTYAVVTRRSDNLIRLYSKNFPESGIVEFNTSQLDYLAEHEWANYPKGIIKVFIDNGHTILHGLDIMIHGDIPNGAGLSSSASIEVLIAIMLNSCFDYGVAQLDLIKWAKYAENNFIGVNCGIMDQFAVVMGKQNQAIILDCNTLNYKYVPLKLDDYNIVIANTNKKRKLSASKYNARRLECETALSQLQKKLSIKSLGELNLETFALNQALIKDPIHHQRAKHAIHENLRTIDAAKALKNGDLIKFGQLMNESHISLRDDYAVTGLELDTLVEKAWQEEGCIGSRMTGAGFGGCTVSLVKKIDTNQFIQNVGSDYISKTNLQANFYIADIGDGAKEIFL